MDNFNTIKNVITSNSFKTAFQKLMLDFNVDVMTSMDITTLFNDYVANLEHDYNVFHGNFDSEYSGIDDLVHTSCNKGLSNDTIINLHSGTVVKVSTPTMNYIGIISKVDPDYMDGTLYFHIGMSDIDTDNNTYDYTQAFYSDAVYGVLDEKNIVEFPTDDEYELFVKMMEHEGVKYLADENLVIPD